MNKLLFANEDVKIYAVWCDTNFREFVDVEFAFGGYGRGFRGIVLILILWLD